MEEKTQDRITPERVAAVRRTLVAAVRQACPSWPAVDREDIVEEAMIRILAILGADEEDEGPPSSYLWKVAHSAIVDEVRRRRRRREVSMDEHLTETPAEEESTSPEDWAVAAEMGREILDCLARLGECRRCAVILRLMGYTVGEVASLLDCSHKRAENLVYRGLADLRRCLRRKGLEP